MNLVSRTLSLGGGVLSLLVHSLSIRVIIRYIKLSHCTSQIFLMISTGDLVLNLLSLVHD